MPPPEPGEPDWRTEAEIEAWERGRAPEPRVNRIRQHHRLDRKRQGATVACICGVSMTHRLGIDLDTKRNELVYWFEMHLLAVGKARRASGLTG